MSEVKIRKLPDWVVDAFRLRAENAGRSLEEELRLLLTEAALKPKQDRALELASFREMLQRKYGTLRDSTEDIRQDRETRG
jgi:plasmid stability protein